MSQNDAPQLEDLSEDVVVPEDHGVVTVNVLPMDNGSRRKGWLFVPFYYNFSHKKNVKSTDIMPSGLIIVEGYDVFFSSKYWLTPFS